MSSMSYLEETKNHIDPVRPGEQWFFYWKTSASLWENKILQFSSQEVIFIPLYWGFHCETGTAIDFGEQSSERDLLRLTKLLAQHGRKFCWLLPLTPAPFFPNGGVPVSAARTLSLDSHGLHKTAIDQEGKLHKMFSFFEPKIFQTFSQCLKAFGSFLTKNRIQAPVWGVQFCYQAEQRESYLNDGSIAFEQGFSRYLKQNFPQGLDLQDPLQESQLKKKFQDEVGELFKATAQETLSPFWSGDKSITVLGGSPLDTIERGLTVGKSQVKYFKEILENYAHDQWVSSSLLTPSEKKDLLPKLLQEHFGIAEIDVRYHYNAHGGELTEEWRPFSLIDLFLPDDLNNTNGLMSFLEENFRWMYQIHTSLNFTTEWIEANHHKVKFFHGSTLDRVRFSQMLKLFLMGQKVILDRTNLHPDLDKRLQVFYLENNLKIQMVNFQTDIHLCDLGEGKFITYEGHKLNDRPEKNQFWKQLFKYLNMSQPILHAPHDVFSLWRIRGTTPHELNYLDVRRVNLYNPTSYKKNVSIQTQKHFAFMKMIDPLRAQAKSTSDGVEVELLPNGKISLDFGHYEEV